MIYIVLAVIVILVLVWRTIEFNKQRKLEFEIELKKQWGALPNGEYTEEAFNKISTYYEKHKGDYSFVIDNITWYDLDMDRIFMAINNTGSAIGEEYLYHMLRTPLFDGEKLEERNRLTSFLLEHEEIREPIRKLLATAGKANLFSITDYIYKLIEMEPGKKGKHYLMATSLLISFGSIFIVPQVGIILFLIVLANNVIQYYRCKAEIENYFVCIYQVSRMLECGSKILDCMVPELENYRHDLKKACSIKGPFLKVSPYLKTGGSMGGNIQDVLLDYIRILFHIDLVAFHSLVSLVKKHKEEVELLLNTIGIIDSSIAVASFRQWLPYYCFPQLVKQNSLIIEAEALYHPLILEPVANSLKEHVSVLITGSNASGKSTYLKTMAINAILSQTIGIAICKFYKANYYKVMSSMAIQDSLTDNDSYYMAEIKSLKRIIDQAEDKLPTLCFIDEVLRGTNTIERIAASTEVLYNLASKNVKCFAATHDSELSQLLQPKFHSYHFREKILENDIIFNYMIYKGPATTRNAIKLLSIMGYEDSIINSAEEMAEGFLKTGTWINKRENKRQ